MTVIGMKKGQFADITSPGGETIDSVGNLDAWLANLKANPNKRPVIHIHGGLVPVEHALAVADKLTPFYDTQAPLFVAWHSGLLEQVRTDLLDYPSDPAFRRLLERLFQFVIGKLRTTGLSLAAGPAPTYDLPDLGKVQAELDNPVPFQGTEADELFLSGPVVGTPLSLSTLSTWRPDEVAVELTRADEAVLFSLFENDDLIKGADGTLLARLEAAHPDEIRPAAFVGGWLRFAAAAVQIARRVFQRRAANRDHGLHATVVEETLREFGLDGVLRPIWSGMKADATAAVADQGVYTELLRRLANLPHAANLNPLIVAHSAGAVHAVELIRRADELLPPDVRFDLVLLAPACTTRKLGSLLETYRHRIGEMRLFGMKDEVERRDHLVPQSFINRIDGWTLGAANALKYLYPHSLLYFVSGICEDGPDMPLVGLQRHHASTYHASNAAVVAYFGAQPDRTVWSIANGGDGLNSASERHGDFDDDAATLDSLGHIAANGLANMAPLAQASLEDQLQGRIAGLNLQGMPVGAVGITPDTMARQLLELSGMDAASAGARLADPTPQIVVVREQVADSRQESQLRQLLSLVEGDPNVFPAQTAGDLATLALTPVQQVLVQEQFPALELHEDVKFDLNTAPSPPAQAVLSYDWGHRFMGHEHYGQGVKVAVIDTGATHSALRVAPRRGRSFAANVHPNDYSDSATHGTHVAGIIAANLPSGSHAPAVDLYIARVTAPPTGLSPQGHISLGSVVNAINWAIDEGVDIINLSLGTNSPVPLIQAATNRAYQKGILVVAAAGNSAGAVQYPARYPNVVAVAAIGEKEGAPFDPLKPPKALNSVGVYMDDQSCFGPEITYAAPGVNITSTVPGNPGLEAMTGTSMAAPHVTGVAAIRLGLKPQLRRLQGPARVLALLAELDQKLQTHGFGAVREGKGTPLLP